MKPDDVLMLENAGWPVLLAQATGDVVHANLAALKVFGASLGMPAGNLSVIWADNSDPPVKFFAHWETSLVPTMILKFRVQDGTNVSFLTSICPLTEGGRKLFLLQLFPDTTSTDTNLAHKQKLDCALQLARTVSHDFNNALTSILGHTSLLLSNAEPHAAWRVSLMEVEKSAERAAEIASDLGAFSLQEKETKASRAFGNLNPVLQRAVGLFQNSTGKNIAWTLQLERRLFAANFDEAKMQQAFTKILENAVETVGAEGRINVITRNVELAEGSQDRNVKLSAGTYVCVEIADTGRGMEADVLPRIFEPFFTTKQSPHRGLGLALVYGIVTNHGGGVAVSSQPGTGTSVRVYIPSERHFVKTSAPDNQDLRGTETILMVDDEELMLTMGETVLSAYGYRVMTANGGAKALEILSRHDSRVDLVITDLVMPAMSGRELVERIQQLSPATRIICTSGFVRMANQVDEAHFLQKPFTSQQLLAKVKQTFAVEAGLVD